MVVGYETHQDRDTRDVAVGGNLRVAVGICRVVDPLRQRGSGHY